MARATDVVHDCGAAEFAGVIDSDIAKTEETLGNRRRDCDVLDLAEWNVSGCASNQSRVDLELRVGQSVTNHISPDVVIGRNQQEGEREGNRDRRGHAKRCKQENECDSTENGECVTCFDKDHRGLDGEHRVFKCVVVVDVERASLPEARVMPLADLRREDVPYFAMLLVRR